MPFARRGIARVSMVLGFAGTLGGCAAPLRTPEAPAAGPPASHDAAARLLEMEDRRAWDRELLDSATRSPDPGLRRRAALAAGRIRGDGAVDLLGPLLHDPDTAVAATAAFALGQTGDTAAAPLLLPLLDAEGARRVPTVVGEAAAALGRLSTLAAAEGTGRLLAALPLHEAPPEAAGPALLALWKFTELSPEAVRWTGSPDPELRWRAAYSLARRGEAAGFAPLLRLVADPDARVRAAAVRGLRGGRADSAGVARAEALRVIGRLLRDPDARVRVNAARTLGSYPTPETAVLLRTALAAGDAVAVAAAEALGRIGPPARSAALDLRGVASDPSLPVQLRSAALLALANVAPGAAVPSMEALSRALCWRLRASAAVSAAVLGPAGAEALRRAAEDPDPRVAAAAIGAAAGEGDSAVARHPELLRVGLLHPDVMVRAAALRGLGRTADPALLPRLLDAYATAQRDTLNDAALAAVEALRVLRDSGTPTGTPFFDRFRRSPDPIVRRAVEEAFGEAALRAWGEARPLETGRGRSEYRRLIGGAGTPAGAMRRVVIETSRGNIELELDASAAPLTVENFLRLASRGYFDGQEWPRVVPNFVIQGGDPRGDTSGGPGYTIRDELNRLRYLRGTVGMALAGPDTGGSQFFITHSPQPHLDGSYTVFGRVVRGMEVVDRILAGDRIVRVRQLP